MNKTEKQLVELYEREIAKIEAPFYIPVLEREKFKKAIQLAYPDLRFQKVDGLETIRDFAEKIDHQQRKKQVFFETALHIIQEVACHPEYTLESRLYEEILPHTPSGNKRLSEEANYFIKCVKVYHALAKTSMMLGNPSILFTPKSVSLENAKSLREIIDLYYRQGQF